MLLTFNDTYDIFKIRMMQRHVYLEMNALLELTFSDNSKQQVRGRGELGAGSRERGAGRRGSREQAAGSREDDAEASLPGTESQMLNYSVKYEHSVTFGMKLELCSLVYVHNEWWCVNSGFVLTEKNIRFSVVHL